MEFHRTPPILAFPPQEPHWEESYIKYHRLWGLWASRDASFLSSGLWRASPWWEPFVLTMPSFSAQACRGCGLLLSQLMEHLFLSVPPSLELWWWAVGRGTEPRHTNDLCLWLEAQWPTSKCPTVLRAFSDFGFPLTYPNFPRSPSLLPPSCPCEAWNAPRGDTRWLESVIQRSPRRPSLQALSWWG